MTKSYKTEAIIVKRINLGEADRIVTALTPGYGKIRFVAKGVRKIKSRFAGSVELFYKSELLLISGKSLDILSNAEIKETYLPSKMGLSELKVAALFGEIIDRVVPDNESDAELFSILEDALRNLDQPELAKILFEARFFRHSGVFPYLDQCVRCQKENPTHFSVQANGALCSDCRRRYADSIPVSGETLTLWKELSNNVISKGGPDEKTIKEISGLSDRYLRTMTTHKFKSLQI